VLQTAQDCRWIRIESDGAIRLTERGSQLRQISEPYLCLREQLYDAILADPPPWSRRIIQGRYEALQAMPDAARQCCADSALIDSTEDDVVEWWDRLSGSVRSLRSKVNHEAGRQAEKLTIEYERTRTGAEPLWQGFETNVAGYDVLSVVLPGDTAKLKIEVKGSRMGRNEASFFVTRNEWNTAKTSTAFSFHLWLVREKPELFVVPAEHVEPHIPRDHGQGRWESAQLYYRDFKTYLIPVN
jgi:hypothetical protein